MPAIHLDLFLTDIEGPLTWRMDDLARCFTGRCARPIIVEGVLLMDALSAIGRAANFLVLVEKVKPQPSRDRSLDDDLADTREFSLGNQISRYLERRQPSASAHFTLSWSET
jgi:hypothetical protein